MGKNRNIWSINFNLLVTLSGQRSEALQNIGFIYDPYTDKIVYGARVAFQTVDELEEGFNHEVPPYSQLQAYTWLNDNEGNFYQSADGRTIKVYCTGNANASGYPADFNKPTYGTNERATQELWFAPSVSFLNRPHDCEIRDIEFTGFGRFVLESVGSNVVVENVKLDLIGGSAFNPANVNTRNFTRSGEGIAVATSAESVVKNVVVRNSSFSRILNAALSLGGFFSSYVKYGAENVIFENNSFRNCPILSGSLYYRNATGWVHGTTMAKNCRFSGNMAYCTRTVFNNSIKINDFALIYGIPGFEISCNTFFDCDYMLRGTKEFGFDIDYGNVCLVKPGQQIYWNISDTELELIVYPDKPSSVTVSEALDNYRAASHDYQTQFHEI